MQNVLLLLILRTTHILKNKRTHILSVFIADNQSRLEVAHRDLGSVEQNKAAFGNKFDFSWGDRSSYQAVTFEMAVGMGTSASPTPSVRSPQPRIFTLDSSQPQDF